MVVESRHATDRPTRVAIMTGDRRSAFDNYVRNAQAPEAAQVSLRILSDGEFAQIADDKGVVQFRGRYWRPPEDSFGLLHVPLSPMSVIMDHEFGYPHPITLGIVARVFGREDDSNGIMRTHILSDAPKFDPFNNLEPSARRNIKSAVSEGVRIELITPQDVGILTRGGYNVWVNSAAGKARPLCQEKYIAEAERMVQDGTLVLAAFLKDKLIGYLSGMAIAQERTAYLKRLILNRSSQYSTANAGSLLTYTFEQICARTQGVDEIVNSRERDAGLTKYKIKMGFPLRDIPVVVKLRPPMDMFFEMVRIIKPELYRRVYGRD